MTGTPSGVGPVSPGDEVTGELSLEDGESLGGISFSVVQRESGYQFKPE